MTIERGGEGAPHLLERVVLRGRIPVPSPGQFVTVTLRREGKPIASRSVPTDPVSGRYRTRLKLKSCCDYVAQARHGTQASEPLALEVSAPPELEPERMALLFNRLLRGAGYHMGDEVTGEVTDATALAIMAMRKVHDLPRTSSYEPRLFETLLRGEGEFEPVNRDPGRHVEVDVSRQVMALIEDGVATDVFHVSTGAGGTPSGSWTFNDKAPGYNAKGMYYSSYYDGNYATHGYASVPTYPASHGCTRNPIQYAIHIYDWIEIGMPIHVYA
ncbi:MAG: L,D-transpeptidase [Solirubrobacterales bacterium]